MEIQEQAESWSIGQLAQASGLPVKTIRFYSDADCCRRSAPAPGIAGTHQPTSRGSS